MAGMPGLLVARVFSGAQVMTVTVSPPEPPVAPGMTPHPAASDAQAASAQARSRRLLLAGRAEVGENVLRVRRLPVMGMHDSVTPITEQ
ncbi:hypothetical protein GCM10010508_40590 [Streptomyces naganishii JCM 4654]|uniref:Uncharacterized protein n=1 Tax=Streptomyces naganishii JCM 4654 TaxID=1306179 RepID=A0A918Y5L1_9ACTN|nr:hypothetical protein GCM10010508_40590 [Streptomyces naganishii JCM 4654]